MKGSINKILFISAITLMLFPLFEQKFHVLPRIRAIDGDTVIAKEPAFNFKDYFSLDYQDSLTNYLNYNFPCRPFYLRVFNQINYDLLRYTPYLGPVIGKNDYLYITSYIDSYTGRNCLPESIIEKTVKRMKIIQDSLKKKNIDLLVIFAPGKASFYPEYLPDKYIAKKKEPTNYSIYSREFKKQSVNYLDLSSYFKSLKKNSNYPLYPKWGVHWSYYGICIAADTIVKTIEQLRHIKMPHLVFDKVKLSDTIKGPDNDVEELLNLYAPLHHTPMPYPIYAYKDENNYKPAVLTVGDSYWHSFLYEKISNHIFRDPIFWRYDKEEYIKNEKQNVPVSKLNIKDKILNQEVIILESTEANYDIFPFGFEDNLDFLFYPNEPRTGYWVRKIKSENGWLEEVKKKAKSRNIPLDSMILLDAKYMVDQGR